MNTQIEDVKKLARELGVDDVRLKSAQVYDFEQDPNQLIPNRPITADTAAMPTVLSVPKNKLANHCWETMACQRDHLGRLVVVRCFDKDATPVGNLGVFPGNMEEPCLPSIQG